MLSDGTPGPTSFTLFTLEEGQGASEDKVALYTVAELYRCNRLLPDHPTPGVVDDLFRRYIRYGDDQYLGLPLVQQEAGLATVCSHCTHQLSCIAGAVKQFTRDGLQDPGRLA
jgi:hypothetical protein